MLVVFMPKENELQLLENNVPLFSKWLFTCMVMLWRTSSVCHSPAQLTQNRASNSPAAQWLQSHSAARTKSHLASFSTVLSGEVDLVSCAADLRTRNIHLEILLEVTCIHRSNKPQPPPTALPQHTSSDVQMTIRHPMWSPPSWASGI